ncbi:50S ribosomal protein L6 [Kiritimatiella glycovorans]|uniref:Large ribosomal subunit protein uL6 n=1 Tax=Kiritimatiella glycovorans TaxID=1307763 RepID=A0A0G3EHP1_9BACT|nr:50S ribosomal protein L6 [Kiritimatiella glycovorans]AKJ64942.1 50S ribosomal protein L6 [Kiritimatiella glycovorans]
MSRIGRQPVKVPSGVEVNVDGSVLRVKGPKGELSLELSDRVAVKVADGEAVVTRRDDDKRSRAMHGTARSLIAGMIEGVTNGYQRELVIAGVGYRAQLKGNTLVLSVGLSHDVEYTIPEGATVEVPSQTEVKVTGLDKQIVGQVAARIRGFAPAEPYKGKGICYKGERIRRKEGKAVA